MPSRKVVVVNPSSTYSSSAGASQYSRGGSIDSGYGSYGGSSAGYPEYDRVERTTYRTEGWFTSLHLSGRKANPSSSGHRHPSTRHAESSFAGSARSSSSSFGTTGKPKSRTSANWKLIVLSLQCFCRLSIEVDAGLSRDAAHS